MQTLVAADARPANCLGPKPAVRSREDLGVALTELAWLYSRQQTVEAALNAKIRLARAGAEEELALTIGEESVPFKARQQALACAIEKYAEKHKTDLLPDDSKTADFLHGQLSWKVRPARIAYAEGEKAETVTDKLAESTSWLDKCLTLLGRLKIGKLPLSQFLRVKAEPNLPAINAAWKEKQCTPEELGQYGLELVPEADVLSIKVHDYAAAIGGGHV